ncbi:MAG: glycosyltransferase [Ginsengibacter sp.]
MEKFSIILPVKNGGEHVKLCINSILSQTINNFNLIILDNCSTDGTLGYIESLADDRIAIYPSSKPLSIEENWRRILSVNKNEFMTMIGHDDLLHPHYLQTMDDLIKKHSGASLYQTHYKFVNAEGEEVGKCLPMTEVQYAHEFVAAQFTRTIDSMGTGYMMRSKDYNNLGGISLEYPNLIFADYALWIDLALLNYKATSFIEAFSYRLHSSTSKLTGAQNYQEAFEKYILFIKERTIQNVKINEAVERYGKDMLMYYSESLSHRLLKTSLIQRQLKVRDFLEKCKHFAALLIPGQPFEPLAKFRIKLAMQLDEFAIGRMLFVTYKKIESKIFYKKH